MDLPQLRKLYAHELANFKWNQRRQFEDAQDEMTTLAILHFNKQVVGALNEYLALVSYDKESFVLATSVLMATLTELHEKEPDKDLCDKALQLARKAGDRNAD